MAKQNEIQYLQLIGSDGINHALNKPFSDASCGQYLMDLGLIMSLLPPPPARLLDLGCGSGWTSIFLAKRGYEVIGLDISNDMINLAQQNKKFYQADLASFIVSDYENLSFSKEFNCAVFYDSLHHAEDEYLALSKVFSALKKEGILITVEPGKGHSNSPSSKLAMEKYGVTEKDMPPSHIIKLAKSIGFSQYKLYTRDSSPNLLHDAHQMKIPLWVFTVNHLKRIIKSAIPQIYFNQGNIVVLKK